MKSDSQIQQDVLSELRWDSRVDETDVGIEVDRGVVTLTGTVSNYGKKLAAEEAAHRVVGVLDVANDIQVHVVGISKRSDTEIAQAVRQALTWDVFIPEERIESTVANGWVTLEGSVDRLRQRDDAERVVRWLQGVSGVFNKISVTAPTVVPQAVRHTIEKALERRAEREAKRITVAVEEGTVTLSGQVNSWPEERAVLEAVAHAPGVSHVCNHMRIEPAA